MNMIIFLLSLERSATLEYNKIYIIRHWMIWKVLFIQDRLIMKTMVKGVTRLLTFLDYMYKLRHLIFKPYYGPGVDSVCNRNDY
jgi:hypothetical protein